MKITYDRQADALAVELAEGRSARTVSLGTGINADLDADGRLLAIEVLGASGAYPAAALEALGSPGRLLTLAEAAAGSGLSPATLRVQLNRGKLAGEKRGRDWLVRESELWNYLERRPKTGRRSLREKLKSAKRRRSAARAKRT